MEWTGRLVNVTQNTTYDKLIATGLSALMQKGYDGIGIGPVLAEAGVPKGSFYHYFSSKDEFVVAVIEAYEAHYSALRTRIFSDRSRPALDRLDAYFGALQGELAESLPGGGCLYGILCQSLMPRSAELRQRLVRAFDDWRASLEHLIAEACAGGELPATLDPAAAASLAIDYYEGALVRAKIRSSTQPFVEFRACLPHLLAVSLPHRPAKTPAKGD